MVRLGLRRHPWSCSRTKSGSARKEVIWVLPRLLSFLPLLLLLLLLLLKFLKKLLRGFYAVVGLAEGSNLTLLLIIGLSLVGLIIGVAKDVGRVLLVVG